MRSNQSHASLISGTVNPMCSMPYMPGMGIR
jgi:hypothetical protein